MLDIMPEFLRDYASSVVAGLADLNGFMSRNGAVLWWLFAGTCLLWGVIAERLLYYGSGSQTDIRRALEFWRGRKERKSWYARKIRIAMLSQVGLNLTRGITAIRMLTMVCSMIGLLGTLLSLISLFDRIAMFGADKIPDLATDLAYASIPALAGMVVALSGVLARFYLLRRANHAVSILEDRLGLDR